MDGIQRLSKMVEGQKDKYLNIIVNHLKLHTELNEAFLNEEKNLKDMAEHIRNKAKKQATNGVAVIEDEIVFKWAREYFMKSNNELGIKKATVVKEKSNNIEKKENKDDDFGSIFDFGSNDTSEEDTNNSKEDIEQISLFAA